MKQEAYSVAEARDQLAALVHAAERGRTVRITRRGKPAAVLISEREFRRSRRDTARGVGDAIRAWRARYGGVALTDAELDSWRDRRSGTVPDLGA